MKKVFIPAITICLALCIAAVSMGAYVYKDRDNVVYKELSHFGDYSKLDGIEVKTRSTLDGRLIWENTVSMGENPKTVSDYHFHVKQQRENYPRSYYGIGMNPSMIFQISRDRENSRLADYFPKAAKKFAEIWDSIGPGEEKTFNVPLKDVMAFYPFGNVSDVPGLYSIEHALFMLENGDIGSNDDEIDFLLFMQEHFKIPVLENDIVEYTIEKDDMGFEGSIGISGPRGKETFDAVSPTAVTDDALYFIFDAHTTKGNLVDLSNLSYGYGIYKIPIGEGELGKYTNYKETSLFIERDPDDEPLDLVSDGENLLLAYEREGKTFIDIIDIENKKLKDTLELIDNVYYVSLKSCDGFVVMDISLNPSDGENVWNLKDRRMGVLEKKGDSYFISFIADRFNEEMKDDLPWSDCRYAYDGTRLVSVSELRREVYAPNRKEHLTYQSPDIFVKVYEKDGPVFVGEYVSSLTTGFTEGNEYRFNVRNFYPEIEVAINK